MPLRSRNCADSVSSSAEPHGCCGFRRPTKTKFGFLLLLLFVVLSSAGGAGGESLRFSPSAGDSRAIDLRRSAWPQSRTGHPIGIGRNLLQQQSNGTGAENGKDGLHPLVVRNRIDPLNHLKRYKGGYNIKNKHYWGSTVFTGIYGYAIAVLWVVAGALYGIYLMVRLCCCKNRRKDLYQLHSRRYYVWPFVLLLVLTVIAIVTSSIALAGNKQFHTRAKGVEKTIVGAAQGATNTIYNVTAAMKMMQEQLLPYNEYDSQKLNSTTQSLETAAANIHDQVYHNKHYVDIGLKILYILATVIISFILAFVLVAVVVLLVHWRHVLLVIIFICWILTALSWALFGVYLSLQTFADDTCLALEEYQQDPENTTLSSILPCVDLKGADYSLTVARERVHNLINDLNRNISRLQMLGAADQEVQVLQKLPYVCDPFTGAPDYKYTPEDCSNDTIQIGQIPQVLKEFQCSKNQTQQCIDIGKYIPQSKLDEAEAYSASIQSLINIFPALQSLTNCSFVKDTFSTILNKQCSPFKSSIKKTWTSLVSLSTGMVFLLIVWITKAYQNRGRHFLKGSVIPQEIQTVANSPRQQNHKLQVENTHTNSSGQYTTSLPTQNESNSID